MRGFSQDRRGRKDDGALPPRIGLVLLAAGAARRYGGGKLLAPWGGDCLLVRALRAALESGCRPLAVVLGADWERVRAVLPGGDYRVVHNRAWAEGMAASMRAGVAVLAASRPFPEALIIALADQPLLQAAHYRQLARTFADTRAPAVAARYGGGFGPPVLFRHDLYCKLLRLAGDGGGRGLIHALGEHVAWVDLPEAGADVDTPDDLERLRSSNRRMQPP